MVRVLSAFVEFVDRVTSIVSIATVRNDLVIDDEVVQLCFKLGAEHLFNSTVVAGRRSGESAWNSAQNDWQREDKNPSKQCVPNS